MGWQERDAKLIQGVTLLSVCLTVTLWAPLLLRAFPSLGRRVKYICPPPQHLFLLPSAYLVFLSLVLAL